MANRKLMKYTLLRIHTHNYIFFMIAEAGTYWFFFAFGDSILSHYTIC